MTTMVIVLKVSTFSQKSKTGMLKTVTKLTGVDEIKVDGEKGTLTVVGSVDAVGVVTALRKAGYSVEITSVGPPKKPEPKPVEPKPDPVKEEPKPVHQCPNYQCQFVDVNYATYDTAFCSIL